jgi:2-polyprenyl-3-methyl-5-hydroxy-6-metoxy-1,4-benzoquinol methylase
LTITLGRRFDLIWCSHVLEHQRNVGAFLDKVFDDLADGGIFAVTVPFALSPMIVGHPNIFTPMHVIYHLVLAGFDCTSARVKTYDQQISVIVRKQYNGVPRSNVAATHFANDANFVAKLRDFFPVEVPPRGHIWGEVESLNW